MGTLHKVTSPEPLEDPETKSEGFSGLSIAKLKQELDDNRIDYPPNAKKQELIDKLEEAL